MHLPFHTSIRRCLDIRSIRSIEDASVARPHVVWISPALTHSLTRRTRLLDPALAEVARFARQLDAKCLVGGIPQLLGASIRSGKCTVESICD